MDYDFDEIIDLQNTDSVKYDLRKAVFGREDVLPMWVADMDFRTPDFIIEAIKSRLEHEVLGYALKPSGLDEAVVNWVPISCIPSPESPEKMMLTREDSFVSTVIA